MHFDFSRRARNGVAVFVLAAAVLLAVGCGGGASDVTGGGGYDYGYDYYTPTKYTVTVHTDGTPKTVSVSEGDYSHYSSIVSYLSALKKPNAGEMIVLYKDESHTDQFATSEVISADTTLYAKYTSIVYTIEFDMGEADGGTLPNPDTVPYSDGAKYKIPENELTKNGYRADGWKKYRSSKSKEFSEGTEYTLERAFGFSNSNGYTITLYPHFEPIDSSCVVKFNVNNPDASPSTIERLPDVVLKSGDVIYFSTYAIKATGYTLEGWYDANNKKMGSSLSYSDIPPGTTEYVLTAKWTPWEGEVFLYDYDGSSLKTVEASDYAANDKNNFLKVPYGVEITLPNATTNKTGKIVIGWEENEEVAKEKSEGTNTVPPKYQQGGKYTWLGSSLTSVYLYAVLGDLPENTVGVSSISAVNPPQVTGGTKVALTVDKELNTIKASYPGATVFEWWVDGKLLSDEKGASLSAAKLTSGRHTVMAATEINAPGGSDGKWKVSGTIIVDVSE